ncbi:MAG: lipocalin-like domain-containing protein [Vicinamibacterales bacterium]|nr:lipocalin-like domain-containing protein [Vicinamibacterales bacterium]
MAQTQRTSAVKAPNPRRASRACGRALVAFAILLAAAPVSAGGLDPSLVGTWRLVRFESRVADGQVRHPMGERVEGQMVYTEAGRISTHIMRAGRAAFASGDRARGTDAETREAFVGYLAYYGTYAVDAAAGTIHHHIAGASFPNWIGTTQVRQFVIDGDELTITTPPLQAAGEALTTVLVWARVSR